jgi:hypothetical protein
MEEVVEAIGHVVKMYPGDFGAKFLHQITQFPELAPPVELGFYPGRITCIDRRSRDQVTIVIDLPGHASHEEDYKWPIAQARERLMLADHEDPWVVLPGKSVATKPKRPSTKVHAMPKDDGKFP